MIKNIEATPGGVFIISRLYFSVQQLLYATKHLHIGRESLGPDFSGIMLPKGSVLKRPFDRMQVFLTVNC